MGEVFRDVCGLWVIGDGTCGVKVVEDDFRSGGACAEGVDDCDDFCLCCCCGVLDAFLDAEEFAPLEVLEAGSADSDWPDTERNSGLLLLLAIVGTLTPQLSKSDVKTGRRCAHVAVDAKRCVGLKPTPCSAAQVANGTVHANWTGQGIGLVPRVVRGWSWRSTW